MVAALACLPGHAEPNLDRVEATARHQYGESVAQRVHVWREMLAQAGTQPEDTQLRTVNRFFNRSIQFSDDAIVWRQKDYWATPLELFAKGAGDCEDFVIAKYLSLRLLGVADEKLRLIYVRAKIGGPQSSLSQAHMVLGYFPTPTAEPLVLDNLVGEILPAAQRPDLFPIFSFNSSGLWVRGDTRPKAGSVERLSRWRDLLSRLTAEGFEP
ncbi:transglutaminase-like cysteine peptidase [Nitrogeniibacter mangrovi]|uniref:transglutaminase-like cysteine peptidase n=1 Tax=Nitrogeniibacter mangrovi TaxID=2016596 RepID=UPI001E3EFFEB|nr:transglutaminase-like cysteine peptidase [Nitrogeniibacter mangrovi]